MLVTEVLYEAGLLVLISQHNLSVYHPENIRKTLRFLMFSGGRGRVHWEQMSWLISRQCSPFNGFQYSATIPAEY